MSQNSSPAELREIGLKVTAPRIKVLEFFQQNPSSHYSAEEVYMALSKDDSDIGIATVLGILSCNAYRACIEMAFTHHDAALND